MPTPAVNVQLLSSPNSITAVISQSTDGTICGNAAINNCQVKKIEFILCDAGIAKLPCSGEDPLSIFDVRPEERNNIRVQWWLWESKAEMMKSRKLASSAAKCTSSPCLHATWTQECSKRLLLEGRQRPPSHAPAEQSGFCGSPCRLCWQGKLQPGPVLAQPSCTTVLVLPCLLGPSVKQANLSIWQ